MKLRHPILARPRDLFLYLGAVPSCAVLLAVLAAPRTEAAAWRDALVLGLPLGLAFALAALLAWPIYGPIPFKLGALPRWLASHLVSALLAAYLLVVLGRVWSRTVQQIYGDDLSNRFRRAEPEWLIAGLVLYLLSAVFHHLSDLGARSRAAERRATSLTARTREAKLKAYKAQIDPHFLFNSLHSLSSLCGFDPGGARRMAILLAGFFRGSVEAGRKDWLPLGEELALIEQYLEIEKVRFVDRLEVEFEVEDKARAAMVPTFLLQPLIENAVKHGIAGLVEGGTVRLEARIDGERLAIAVANPSDPDRPRPQGTATGLANVRGRLLTLFGPESRFDVEETPETFRVRLAFPYREEENDG